jgi:copper chaperone CopZ
MRKPERSDRRIVARLVIPGMTAVHATRAVFTALGGVPGVERADVSRGIAIVEHDGTVTEARLRDAIALAGFAVAGVTEERAGLPVAEG